MEELLKTQSVVLVGHAIHSLDVSDFSNGNYTLSVISDLTTLNKKFTILK